MKWIVLIAILLFFIVAFIDSNTRLSVSRYEVALARLPSAFDGFKIVHLSDLHLQEFGRENAALLQKIRDAQPDIIVYTGDLGSRDIESNDSKLEMVTTLFHRLTDIAPTYFVTGNHDIAVRGWVKNLTAVFAETGVTFLQNEFEYITRMNADGTLERLCIAGVHDKLDWRSSTVLSDVRADIRRMDDCCVVLLSHRYELLEEYAALEYDLVLSGHAHGGLIRLPLIGPLLGPAHDLFPEHAEGVNRRENTVMVTSRGLQRGFIMPRLFNNPEIVVITLRCGS